jgi:hypothetical protein
MTEEGDDQKIEVGQALAVINLGGDQPFARSDAIVFHDERRA